MVLYSGPSKWGPSSTKENRTSPKPPRLSREKDYFPERPDVDRIGGSSSHPHTVVGVTHEFAVDSTLTLLEVV